MANAFGYAVIAVALVLVLYILLASWMEHNHLHLFHESVIALLIGGALGYILTEFFHKKYHFDESLFQFLILPPILFSLGYNMRKRSLFKNFSTSVLYGVGGTILNFILLFLVLQYIISDSGLVFADKLMNSSNDKLKQVILQENDCLYIAACLSSIDAVIGFTFINYTVHPDLYSIVFGEGMLNDATALILFLTVGNFTQSSLQFAWKGLFIFLWNFIKNTLVSMTIGTMLGFLTTYFFKKFRFLSHNLIHELVIFVICGYSSYVVAEVQHYSGVISLLMSAIILSKYNFYNLSNKSKLLTGYVSQSVALLAEGFMFIYLGISTFTYSDYDWSFSLIVTLTFVLVLLRFVILMVLTLVAKYTIKNWKFKILDILVLYFSGLLKAGVAFSLVLTIPKSENQQLVKTTVFGVITFTILVINVFATRILHKLLQIKEDKNDQEVDQQSLTTKITLQTEDKWYQGIDEKYIKNWFIHDYENVKLHKRKLRNLKMNSIDVEKPSEHKKQEESAYPIYKKRITTFRSKNTVNIEEVMSDEEHN